jgi:RNA polymerase sigma-70 factor (ECF subfamily)
VDISTAARAELAGKRMRPPDDRERFEALLDRHHRKLRRFVAGLVTDRDRVEDVLQEAYLRAYRGLPRLFANEAHERAWIYRVVYRCCIDELRRAPRHAALLNEPAYSEQIDRRIALDRALRGLKPSDRAVIYLVGFAGLGQADAARVLGIPRGTVAWRLSVARKRFHSLLESEGFDDA